MNGEYERKDQAFTVTVVYAPQPWLPSREHLLEVPVRCLVSHLDGGFRLDLATPLCPLPAELVKPVAPGNTKGGKLRQGFRLALMSAVERHLGYEVRLGSNDRIDWGHGEVPTR